MNQQLSVDIYNIITVYVLEHFEGVKYTNLAAIPAFPFQKNRIFVTLKKKLII